MIKLPHLLSTKSNSKVNSALTHIAHTLNPARCLLCDMHIVKGLTVCTGCHADLEWNHDACLQCAEPMVVATRDTHVCPTCLATPPPVYRTIAPLRYAFPVKECVQALKYDGKRFYAGALAKLIAPAVRSAYLEDTLPECLIPVPMYRKKERTRGLNQAALIAKKLAPLFNIRLDTSGVFKATETASQTTKTKAQRQRNLKHSFAVARHFQPLTHVAVVDDVMTTGATLHALAETLHARGVERIDAWCVARTVKDFPA